ncbi:MAG TPA: Ldh family oxidoreductase [Mesorhizobium sp.]|jgi:(2R)-3-sulfolactate dehydrogenase (NADP+)|nr:Ldh family oxidoreductase [Mesorhizobium sp.]
MSAAVAVAEIERVALGALVRAGASAGNAAPVARAIARAEAEGNRVCGLFYLPIFCSHLRCGKVDGHAAPSVERGRGAVRVDARGGFAHPAIAAGLPPLADAARQSGVAALAVRNSYNCLALGHHVTPLAERGLIGLCVANAPASVAPPGARAPIFGTNPLAFAVPCPDRPPIVVDQSMSAVTKTAIVMRRDRGEPIPLGWAQDRSGAPTADPAEGLLGSLLPSGGQKGANIALLIEILAAALTGSKLSMDASMFGDDKGGPPGTGQFLLAIDPARFGNDRFGEDLARLAGRFGEAGARLPGRGPSTAGADCGETLVEVDPDLWKRACELAP